MIFITAVGAIEIRNNFNRKVSEIQKYFGFCKRCPYSMIQPSNVSYWC